MKSFISLTLKSLPLAVGIVFSLLSIAMIVSIANGEGDSDSGFAAVFCGLLGYPLIIAGAKVLIDTFSKESC